jgi:hypothetical protein
MQPLRTVVETIASQLSTRSDQGGRREATAEGRVRSDELSRLLWSLMDWKVYGLALIHPYGVNITKQPGRITLEPTEMANVLAETQGITNR